MTWSGPSRRLCSFFRVSTDPDALSLQHVCCMLVRGVLLLARRKPHIAYRHIAYRNTFTNMSSRLSLYGCPSASTGQHTTHPSGRRETPVPPI